MSEKEHLASVSKFPPGGWQFRVAETGWCIAKPMETSFTAAVAMIRRHARANPKLGFPDTFEFWSGKLQEFTLLRMNEHQRRQFASKSAPYQPPQANVRCGTCG